MTAAARPTARGRRRSPPRSATAVAEDVAAFTRRQGRPPGLRRRDRRARRAVDGLPRADPARLRQGRHRRPASSSSRARPPRPAVTATIRELNDDPTVDGVIVQMPLPPTIRLRAVVDAIDPAKDIDGIHPLNAGLLRLGYDGFLPATAHAAVEILRRSGIEIEGTRRGRHRSVGGRRDAGRVPARPGGRDRHGLPLADPRPRRPRRRTPTSSSSPPASPASSPARCSSRGAVVVDVGINVVDGAIVGDVDFESAARGRLGDHAGPRRRRAADQRAAAGPSRPRRRSARPTATRPPRAASP